MFTSSILAYTPFLTPLPLWSYWPALLFPLCAIVATLFALTQDDGTAVSTNASDASRSPRVMTPTYLRARFRQQIALKRCGWPRHPAMTVSTSKRVDVEKGDAGAPSRPSRSSALVR